MTRKTSMTFSCTRRCLSTTLTALALVCGSSASLGAETVHQVIPLSGPIDALLIRGDIDVALVQDGTAQAIIDGPADIAREVRISVDHGTLRIDQQSSSLIGIFTTHHPVITLHVAALSKIKLTSSADLTVQGWSSAGDLELETESSGDVRINNLHVRKITTSIRGSSDVTISGVAVEQDARLVGSGDYDAKDLKSVSAAVAILGSGDASIWAEQALAITIKGSGDVEYYGSPTLAQSVKGSGDVTSRGPKS
jgi:hypothetical protein